MAADPTPYQQIPPCTVAVVGGGISGLAAAHRLRELAPQLRTLLFESQSRLGGVLHTEQADGYLLEHSADMFTTAQPWALDLCRRIDFESELLEPNQENRRAFVVKNDRLHPVPDGLSLLGPSRIWPLVTTRLLSVGGKLRMLAEMFIGKKDAPNDESLADFTRRRLGSEAFDWLIQPLVGGIYTADPEKLSMLATLPQFLEMEQTHGSLFRGMRKNKAQRKEHRQASGARYGMFRAPRCGMSALVQTLTDRLAESTVVSSCRIRTLRQSEARSAAPWRLESEDGRSFDAAACILATPASVAADITEDAHPLMADNLRRIPLAGVVIVALGVPVAQFRRPPNGFGFVTPQAAQRSILAGSFSSIKFSGRAPDGEVLVRAFVGGACQPELMELDDEEIINLVWKDLAALTGVTGQPTLTRVVRWRNTMPQYHVGHVQLIDEIESQAQELDGLELAGNAYRGVGIPFCIRSGEQAAERILQRLQESST